MTQTRPANGHVVVGYDGSAPARHALDWAATYADRTHTPLTILTAQEIITTAPHETGWTPDIQQALADVAQHLLSEASEIARAAHPGLEVATTSAWGSPAAALVAASEGARTVVVGSRGVSGWGQVLLGSVSQAVAAHAASPVVVVRDGVPTPAGAPVVVGIDGSPESRAAAAAAFRYAKAFGVPVQAVHAWTLAFHGGVVPTDPGSEASRAFETQTTRLLDDVLAEPARAHQDVAVERVVRQGTPSRVLADLAAGASLVVVGSRGRGGFRGLLLGSTSRNVLLHCTTPVAVIRG